jgi:hypothetical protein
MPRFAFSELIGSDDELAPSEGEKAIAKPVAVVPDGKPEMGSLFGDIPPPETRQTSIMPASRSPHMQAVGGPSPHIHRPISRRIQNTPRSSMQRSSGAVAFPSPMKAPSAITTQTFRGGASSATAVPHRVPKAVTPTYLPKPAISLECADAWQNDAGLFLGRSFRACFSPSGVLFMPANVRPGSAGREVHGHKVAMVPMKERIFKRRSYEDIIKVHREMREMVDRGSTDPKDIVKVTYVCVSMCVRVCM